MSLVNKIDELLPQTQCKECGFLGCRPYAEALARGISTIDHCPPGGDKTVNALAKLLQIDATPYLKKALENHRPPALAIIREAECIGCTKCIQACPVDAIVGTAKHMHSIIQHECTGCGLCVEPCPVDCIEIALIPEATYDKTIAKNRFNNREIRLLQEKQEKERLYQEKRKLAARSIDKQKEKSAKQDYILQALERIRAKKHNE